MKNFNIKAWARIHAAKASEWVRTHKPHTAGIATAVIVAIALIVATASGAFAPTNHKNSVKPAASASSDAGKAEKPADVDVSVAANEGWTKDSTPVIVHVKTSDGTKKKDAVDFYHAVSAAEDNKASDSISLTPDKYAIEVISPLNSDGSVMAVYNTSDSKDHVSVVSESAITIKKPTKVDAKASDTDVNKIDITLNKVPAEQVTDDMVSTIIDKTKTAVDNGDTTLKGDAGKEVLDKVENNTKASPNVSEATTEKAEGNKTTADTSTETAKPTTTPSAGKSNANSSASKSDSGTAKGSGSSNVSQPKSSGSSNVSQPKSSGSSSASQPKSEGNNSASKSTQAPASNNNKSSNSSSKPAEKPKKWVPEQGHYENITEKVWVSRWVEEPVYETKKVYVDDRYIFAEDGYATTDDDDAFNHSIALMKQGYAGNYRTEPVYETKTVQTGTKKVDKGNYQTKVTGKKWVVDIPGHYE